MNGLGAIGDIEKWLAQIPAAERNVPYFIVDAPGGPTGITPQEAIDELSDTKTMTLRAGGVRMKLGRGQVPFLEQLNSDYDLLLEQAKARAAIAKAEGHSGFLGNLDGEYFSIDDIVEHIENNTERGKQFRRMYRKLYIELIRKLV